MTPGPLSQARILVLRAAHQAEPTVAAIRGRGAEPVVFPVIEILSPPDPAAVRCALGRLGEYDWVLFTSANGVDRCWAELERIGLDARGFDDVRVAAIGPKTAERLAARGLRAHLVAKQYVAEQLARELLQQPNLSRVLLLRALTAREILPELLERGGVQVDVVPVYRTRPVPSDRAPALSALFEQRSIDVVMFTSSSTVTAFAELLGPRTAALLRGVTVASIGPITSNALEQIGIEVDVAAAEHTVDGLLDALEAHSRTARARS